MIKKFIVILVLFCVVLVGLQLFGGRDFTQITIAWDKYQHGGDLGGLTTDVGVIFSGEKVSESGLATAKLADRLIYRWTDKQGTVHNSERLPAGISDYQVIRMGDLTIETQKAMTKEEIEAQLGKQ
jgi:hypothetical protein